MSVKEIPSYRVVCDAEGCEASPSDDSDFYCWAQPEGALDALSEADWFSHDDKHLCPEHAPECSCPGCDACMTEPGKKCGVTLRDNEFGKEV